MKYKNAYHLCKNGEIKCTCQRYPGLTLVVLEEMSPGAWTVVEEIIEVPEPPPMPPKPKQKLPINEMYTAKEIINYAVYALNCGLPKEKI